MDNPPKKGPLIKKSPIPSEDPHYLRNLLFGNPSPVMFQYDEERPSDTTQSPHGSVANHSEQPSCSHHPQAAAKATKEAEGESDAKCEIKNDLSEGAQGDLSKQKTEPESNPKDLPKLEHAHNGSEECDDKCKGAIKKIVPASKGKKEGAVNNQEDEDLSGSETIPIARFGPQADEEELEILTEEEKIQNIKSEFCPIPKYFDSYILGEIIGEGSFANLYKAFDKNKSISVAAKCYRYKTPNCSYFARVANEAAFLKMLKHPHIIKHIASSIRPQYTYITLEYCGHGSLKNFMKSDACLPEEFVQAVMKQLLGAMYYLHTMCITHADIKPDNIILMKIEPNPIIKLIDFGIAEVTLKNDIFRDRAGSFAYMAPELLLGYPSDYKSDLFSAGVTMFEMLYGFRLFREASRNDRIKNYRKREDIIFPEKRTAELSEPCVGLVKNLLSYDKYKRLSGCALLEHPFLKLKRMDDEQDHHYEGYKRFLKGASLIDTNQYGLAYIEINAAILHLQIFSNGLPDYGFYRYMCVKIDKYKSYLRMLEDMILDNKTGSIHVVSLTEKLRCLLQTSPLLLFAFDSCAAGEMYYWLKRPEVAKEKLKRGFEILIRQVREEPQGSRKSLLSKKLSHWFIILHLIQEGRFHTLKPSLIRGM